MAIIESTTVKRKILLKSCGRKTHEGLFSVSVLKRTRGPLENRQGIEYRFRLDYSGVAVWEDRTRFATIFDNYIVRGPTPKARYLEARDALFDLKL